MTPSIRLSARVIRAAKPYWMYAPSSGQGAARHGGRFNPVGMPALYASFSFEAAAREVRFSVSSEPYTFYFLEVDAWPVADLVSTDVRGALGVQPDALACPNWESEMNRGIEPASHALARRLIAQGYAGIVVPSFARGARAEDRNLVLWQWEEVSEGSRELEARSTVRVLERASLPSDLSSWPGRKSK